MLRRSELMPLAIFCLTPGAVIPKWLKLPYPRKSLQGIRYANESPDRPGLSDGDITAHWGDCFALEADRSVTHWTYERLRNDLGSRDFDKLVLGLEEPEPKNSKLVETALREERARAAQSNVTFDVAVNYQADTSCYQLRCGCGATKDFYAGSQDQATLVALINEYMRGHKCQKPNSPTASPGSTSSSTTPTSVSPQSKPGLLCSEPPPVGPERTLFDLFAEQFEKLDRMRKEYVGWKEIQQATGTVRADNQ